MLAIHINPERTTELGVKLALGFNRQDWKDGERRREHIPWQKGFLIYPASILFTLFIIYFIIMGEEIPDLYYYDHLHGVIYISFLNTV